MKLIWMLKNVQVSKSYQVLRTKSNLKALLEVITIIICLLIVT